MRLIFSEFPADYAQYHFPYQIWAVREHKDNLAQMYTSGWLPFRSKPNLYYLARGTRIRLSKFQLSSENRRILRKTEGLTFNVQPVEQFTYTPVVQKLCANFSRSKFGKGVMPTAAIRKLFTNSNTTHVITFSSPPYEGGARGGLSESTHSQGANQTVDQIPANHPHPLLAEGGGTIGYVAAVVHDHFLHYDHPFYDLNFPNPDLGMGMLTRAIEWAHTQHKQFAYLGTCYTPESLYKTQFSGFEFFNGFSWSANLEELKHLISKTSSEHLLNDPDYRKKYLPKFSEEWLTDQGVRVGFK